MLSRGCSDNACCHVSAHHVATLGGCVVSVLVCDHPGGGRSWPALPMLHVSTPPDLYSVIDDTIHDIMNMTQTAELYLYSVIGMLIINVGVCMSWILSSLSHSMNYI